jgi:hypothetical protein
MSDNKRGIKKTTKDCLVLISITLSTKAQFVVDVSQGIKSEFLPYEHQLGYKKSYRQEMDYKGLNTTVTYCKTPGV